MEDIFKNFSHPPLGWKTTWLRTFVSLTTLLLVLSGCSGAVNNPRLVAETFLDALATGSTGSLDTIVAWDKVLLEEYYVTQDYFVAQEAEKKHELIQSYKEQFFQDYLPQVRRAEYQLKSVVTARWDSDAFIQVSYPDSPAASRSERKAELEFVLSIQFNEEENRWYIVDLGDFLHLSFIQGDFNRRKMYLPEPIQP